MGAYLMSGSSPEADDRHVSTFISASEESFAWHAPVIQSRLPPPSFIRQRLVASEHQHTLSVFHLDFLIRNVATAQYPANSDARL
jgi:hypothetical protein